MERKVELRGSSWGHTRGHDPLVAASGEYADDHTVNIEWTARTLTEFGVLDIGDLARQYDLVVIDHPHVGGVAASKSLVPLDSLISAETLEELGKRSPGKSHQSYNYAGHQWAVAIDTACQVAAWKATMPQRDVPSTWKEVIELARSGGVIWPINPVDIQASFMTIAAGLGTPIDGTGDQFVPLKVGLAVFEAMHAVTRHLNSECFELNAIGALEALSTRTDEARYCPLVFGYTNYSRLGYREQRLEFGNIAVMDEHSRVPKGALLGGVGLGVSAVSEHIVEAAEFAVWVASGPVQNGVFFEAGGQPAHVSAWENEKLDSVAGGFFSGTRATVDNSWMRPRMPGYVSWQNESLAIVHETLKRGSGFEAAVLELNKIAPKHREEEAAS